MNVARRAEGSRADVMRVALVGVGYWGSKLLRNLVNVVGLERTVVVDNNLKALQNAYETYPGITTYLTIDDALMDDSIGAFIIASQASSHHWMACKVLEAGMHVMIEKPLASSVAEAADIARLGDEHGLTVMVGHTFLFSPRVEFLTDLVRERRSLGDLHYMTSSRLNLGLFRNDANVIWDLGPHDFSIIFNLLDETPQTMQTAARSILGDGTPDVAFVNMTFPSGLIATVSLSWMSPRKERRMILVGDQGMIHFDDAEAEEPIRIFDKGIQKPTEDPFGSPTRVAYRHGDTVVPYVDNHEPLNRQIVAFLQSIRTGRDHVSNGHFGVQVVAALEAADMSWRQGGAAVSVSSGLEPVS